jgi:toxin FitB
VILLDTNVVSALMRSEPDPIVVAWLDELPPESVWTTSITRLRDSHGLGLAAERRRAGRTVEIRDVQIAGIAAARKATLATGNLRHFEGLGLALVNPWAV